jgi:arsenical pump membrane protein
MQTLIACSTFAVAVTLAVRRPKVGATLEIGPAAAAVAGMICLLAFGVVRPADLVVAIRTLWRPLLTIVAIMITTSAARRAGVIDGVAALLFARRAASVRRLFASVFALSLATASLLSNDAAVLLLTPLVLTFVRHQFPDRPGLLVPFAFAVFMAAGVAPFVTSNPMNMVVASYVGLNFNDYAAAMLPISLVGSLVSFLLLRNLFGRQLAESGRAASSAERPTTARFTETQLGMLLLLVGVVAMYPLVARFNGAAIWIVAAVGAALAVWLVRGADADGPDPRSVWRGVSWEVVIFLPAVFVLSIGLRNVGLVDLLTSWYRDAGVWVIGGTAAIGSAALNNHPMALVNMLALESRRSAGTHQFLAALVGGDLGPRLLPTGSLAGLLWLECCRRLGVHIPAGRFVAVGAVLTLPTLIISLAMLALF